MRITISQLLLATFCVSITFAILTILGVFDTPASTLNARTVDALTAAPSPNRDPISLVQIIELLKTDHDLDVDLVNVSPTKSTIVPHYDHDSLKPFLCWSLWQMGLSFRVKAGRIEIGPRQSSDHNYYIDSIDCYFFWTPKTDKRFAKGS